LGLEPATRTAIADDWWRAFGDPQLDALVRRADRDSPTLSDALARLEHARADASAELGGRGPNVDLSASAIRSRFSELYIIPPPYGGGTFWDSQLEVALSYDVDLWGRQRARIRAAQRYADARELDARAARLAVEGSVVSGYIDLDRRYQLAEIARSTEQTRTELATLTGRRVDAGLDSAVERETAEAAMPEARADREQAVAAIELGLHQLAALTGQGAEAYGEITRPNLDYTGAWSLPAVIPGDLLARRPDIAAARARVEAAAATEEVARLAAYPDINLRAFAGYAALTLTDLLSAPARSYGIGPAVQLPIFDRGRLRARARGAAADVDAAIADYNATVLDAVRQVADAVTTIEALDREARDAAQRCALLEAVQKLAVARFRGGLAGRTTVLDADIRLLAARRMLVMTRASAAQARVTLIVSLGGGLGTEPAGAQASAKAFP
jgi:NodT family efflux transporter outer membrane factor (OMF) lipoprotein